MILDVGAGQTYPTIQEAVDAAIAGDSVAVHAGTYAEDLVLAGSGAEGARIVLETAGDGAVIVQGAHRVSGDYWDVDGLSFEVSPGADGLRVTGSHNRFLSIEMTGGDRDAIDGSGIGNEVRGSIIHQFDAGDADAHCIVLNPGAEDWVIDDSELFDCSGDSIQLYASAAERTIKNTTISNNRMYWSGAILRMENAVDVKNADGLSIVGNEMYGFIENKTIVMQKGPIDVEVRCNVIHGGFTGVEFRAEDGGVVEDVRFVRNLMYDMTDYGLKFDGVVGGAVHSNTFVNIASDGLRLEGGGLTSGTVHNNLWLQTGAIDGPGGLTADHNAFFMTGTVGIASATDVTTDPLLDAEYRLQSGSPLIDMGVDVGRESSGAAPDIGWDEFGIDACGEIGSGGGGEGEGGAGAGGESAGAGGESAGAGAGAGAGGESAGDEDGGEDGCSCEVAGGDARPAWAVWLLVASLALRSRAGKK